MTQSVFASAATIPAQFVPCLQRKRHIVEAFNQGREKGYYIHELVKTVGNFRDTVVDTDTTIVKIHIQLVNVSREPCDDTHTV